MWKMESSEVLGVQTPNQNYVQKVWKNNSMTPIFGIGPKFPIFKTLQITKDWGWNEDNEQDWVPKNGGLLT